jgi:hypothetical protein
MALNEVQTGITDQTGGFASILNGITRTDDAMKKLERSGKQTSKVFKDFTGMVGQFTGLSIGVGAIVGAVGKASGIESEGGVMATALSSAGAWGGPVAGAKLGAMLGTMIAPGVGTVIGGIAGTIGGSIAGVLGGTIAGNALDRGLTGKRWQDIVFPAFEGTALTADMPKAISAQGYQKYIKGGDPYFDQKSAKPLLGLLTESERKRALEIGKYSYDNSQEVKALRKMFENQALVIERMSRK